MKLQIAAAAFVLAAVPAFAQTTGVSHPDPAVITSDDEAPCCSSRVDSAAECCEACCGYSGGGSGG